MTPNYWSQAVADLSRVDPVLAGIIAGYRGECLVGCDDPFGTLAHAIVGQQISVKAAASVWNRLGENIAIITPASVAAAGENSLTAAGLSRRKATYLSDLAGHFLTGAVAPGAWENASDEVVVANLVRVKGIGRWTAEMFLIFHLMRPDVLPLADIGLRKAISRHYANGAALAEADMDAVARPWRPWRSVATWYLWRSLDPLPVAY